MRRIEAMKGYSIGGAGQTSGLAHPGSVALRFYCPDHADRDPSAQEVGFQMQLEIVALSRCSSEVEVQPTLVRYE